MKLFLCKGRTELCFGRFFGSKARAAVSIESLRNLQKRGTLTAWLHMQSFCGAHWSCNSRMRLSSSQRRRTGRFESRGPTDGASRCSVAQEGFLAVARPQNGHRRLNKKEKHQSVLVGNEGVG